MEFAAVELGPGVQHRVLHILGHVGPEIADGRVQQPHLVLGHPGAVQHPLALLGVEGPELRQVEVGHVLGGSSRAEVEVPVPGPHAGLLRQLQEGGLVHHAEQEVDAGIEQRVGRLGRLLGIEEGADQHRLHRGVGVHRPGAEQQAVHVVERRGGREGADVADAAVAGEVPGGHAQLVGGLLVGQVEREQVVAVVVPVDLAELGVGSVVRHLGQQPGVLGVGKDDVVAVVDQLLECLSRPGVEADVRNERGLQPVAESGLRREAAAVVLLGPAVVVGRADVHPRGLDLVLARRGGRGRGRGRRRGRGRCGLLVVPACGQQRSSDSYASQPVGAHLEGLATRHGRAGRKDQPPVVFLVGHVRCLSGLELLSGWL